MSVIVCHCSGNSEVKRFYGGDGYSLDFRDKRALEMYMPLVLAVVPEVRKIPDAALGATVDLRAKVR